MANQVHSFNIGEDYTVPQWSAKSPYKYFFEVIKNGVPIEEKDISYKPFLLLGKYQDLCDFVLEHPTISRKHAIVQHKANGEIFIYDLGSSHGTFVNNKRLPSKIYHKLNPFDSLRFANSTRIYILRCIQLEEQEQQDDQQQQENVANTKEELKPEEGQKELMKDEKVRTPKELKEFYLNLRDNDPYYKQQNKKHKLTGGPSDQNNNDSENDNGITWGIGDEQEVYDYQDESQIALIPDLLKRLPNLNEKQIEKIEKYEERLNKYRNAEQELEELVSKERKEYGLEEKLKVKKEKLQAKMLELQTSLDQAEANVRLSLFNEAEDTDEQKKKRTFSKFEESRLFDDEDDEFFDRTKTSKKVQIDHDERKKLIMSKIENTTENFWGLKKKLEKLITERYDYNKQVLDLNSDSIKKKDNKEGDDEEDELEAYMKKTNETLLKENREKLFSKIRELNNEIDLISDMLKYIKPDTEIDYEQFENGLEKQVFGNHDDEDEEEDEGLVKKNSILKEERKQKQQDKVSLELAKLRELKQKKIEQQRILEGDNKEASEEDVIKAYEQKLKQQSKYEKSEEIQELQKYNEEFGADGEDAPALVGTNQNKKVYQVAQKPQSRNQKASKEQEACVDLTYMQTMEEYNEIYNQEMSKKFGY
ncbi:hypothetical protein ABPG72_012032 [Tetrahymena utriculariae]